MRICIPTRSDDGLHARCVGDIRTAQFFTLVDVGRDKDEVTVIANKERGRDRGVCDALEQVGMDKIDAIVCKRIGRGAYYSLTDAGLDVYLSERNTVDQLVADMREGLLRPASDEEIGSGRGHHHDRCRHRRSGSRHRRGRDGVRHRSPLRSPGHGMTGGDNPE